MLHWSFVFRPSSNMNKAWELLLDLVYPPRCGGCDLRGTLLCARCHALIEPPEPENLQLNQLNLLVCAGVFGGPLRSAIHNFKYNSDTPLAKPLALLLSNALAQSERFAELADNEPTLIPVPLHATRLRTRGYNQADLLTRQLSQLTGWKMETGLVRIKDTRSQVGLTVEQRGENVADAFAWTSVSTPTFALLIDDVCTTGATLAECAATLRSKGVTRVCAVTVAKATGLEPDSDSRR